jgi:hypothetical protein
LSRRALNLFGLGAVAAIGLAFLLLTPRLADLNTELELTVYAIMAILALSLALVWGYGGILCFGQSALARSLSFSPSLFPRSSPRCSAISCSTVGSATSILA